MPIQADRIRSYLADLGTDIIDTIDIFSSITSTNDYLAHERFSRCKAVCIANQQTQGRGRFGHQWWSPPGVNLYLSMAWPMRQWHRQYEKMSLWVLVAIAQLLERLEFSGVQLKWPNDICIDYKKVGGILIERKSNQLIIGIGLNIAMSNLKNTQLKNAWTDLISNKPDWEMCINEFAAQVIATLFKIVTRLENLRSAGLSSKWSRYDMLFQHQVTFTHQGKRTAGIVRGIDERGQIIMDINGESLHLHSSQISDIKL